MLLELGGGQPSESPQPSPVFRNGREAEYIAVVDRHSRNTNPHTGTRDASAFRGSPLPRKFWWKGNYSFVAVVIPMSLVILIGPFSSSSRTTKV